MATKLTIKNLKNIQQLDFEIPGPGSYLLTGNNGSGKTSLLTCLSRLRNSGAFQRGFRSSFHEALDSHRGASVEYQINGNSVIYTYVEERWAPLPRKNSGLLSTCGHPEVLYIAADAQRVEPQQQEFAPRRVRLTDQSLRDGLNQIFSTDRFSELCYINLNRGGQQKAYIIRQTRPGKATTYFSEKNFSLGELCILKLLLSLQNIADNSLLLIDELELAIHPRAQIKLFSHLTKFATDKKLTIIFSTHSVSLIKHVDRRKILFLDNQNGKVTCLKGCYPTFALGQITSGEEVAPDCVVYVEDDSAKKCIQSMIRLYLQTVDKAVAQPTVVVVPLGGFSQILEFIDKAPQLLPKTTRLKAILDNDVQTESLAQYELKSDHYMLELFSRLEKKIAYLPWTPEVGLIELFNKNEQWHELELKKYFDDQRVSLPQDWKVSATLPLTPKKTRDAAKKSVSIICKHLETLLGKSNDRIREHIFDYLVRTTQSNLQFDSVKFIGNEIHA